MVKPLNTIVFVNGRLFFLVFDHYRIWFAWSYVLILVNGLLLLLTVTLLYRTANRQTVVLLLAYFLLCSTVMSLSYNLQAGSNTFRPMILCIWLTSVYWWLTGHLPDIRIVLFLLLFVFLPSLHLEESDALVPPVFLLIKLKSVEIIQTVLICTQDIL